MNTKSFLLSTAALLAAVSSMSAQSIPDFPGLFGRQGRSQENAVKVEYGVDFQYFFDLRSFGASDEIFMKTETYNLARFSPSAIVRFDQGRDATHRLALGIDLTKDLGVNPTSDVTYSDAEHDSSIRNTGLMKDIFFYYNYRNRTGKGILDLYAGIHPRTVLEGEYTRAIFADDINYYDPNLEGMTFKYAAPKFSAELSTDLIGKKGVDRVGGEMVTTAGVYKPFKWASAGWAASYTHVNGTYIYPCDVESVIANPYIKLDAGPLIGMQALSLKAGALASYQFDYRIEDEQPHFPMGFEAVLNVRHWNLGLENTFFYGDNMMVYYSASYGSISSAAVYASTLYSGDDFYFTHRGFPAWYDRAELYWKPLEKGFVSTRFSAVAHFVLPTDTIGPFIGMQAKASLIFNLDAFRHPKESVQQGRARSSSRRERSSREAGGPIFRL